jgi:hypothetical protein
MLNTDSLLCNKVDQILYHYTGVDTLIGIANAETKVLWASNVYFLNDSEEITYACNVINEILLPRMAFGNYQYPEDEFIKQLQILIKLCSLHTYNIFVFSLSENSSLLSQWRSYTPHGKGVSIGISARALHDLAQLNQLKIVKCVYDRVKQEEIINTLIDKLLMKFRHDNLSVDISKLDSWQSYHPYLDSFTEEILQVLSVIKHEAFKEECEWRLISPLYQGNTNKEIKYREGSSMLLPYIELQFGDAKSIFEEVILGPSIQSKLSLTALSMFLDKNDLCYSTRYCDIPYREW